MKWIEKIMIDEHGYRAWFEMTETERIKLLFAWYDLWVGFFWDSKKKWLYFFPVPCFGIIFKFKNRV